MKIATSAYPLDFHRNWADYAAKIETWVADAAGQGAELLLFPEYGAMELATLAGAETAADHPQGEDQDQHRQGLPKPAPAPPPSVPGRQDEGIVRAIAPRRRRTLARRPGPSSKPVFALAPRALRGHVTGLRRARLARPFRLIVRKAVGIEGPVVHVR